MRNIFKKIYDLDLSNGEKYSNWNKSLKKNQQNKTKHTLTEANGRRFYYERCGGHFLVTLILWSPEKYIQRQNDLGTHKLTIANYKVRTVILIWNLYLQMSTSCPLERPWCWLLPGFCCSLDPYAVPGAWFFDEGRWSSTTHGLRSKSSPLQAWLVVGVPHMS